MGYLITCLAILSGTMLAILFPAPDNSILNIFNLKNTMWWIYALLSALFAALTAIFAKAGIKGVDTDLATAIRTIVILIIAWGIAFFRGGAATIYTLTKQNIIFLC